MLQRFGERPSEEHRGLARTRLVSLPQLFLPFRSGTGWEKHLGCPGAGLTAVVTLTFFSVIPGHGSFKAEKRLSFAFQQFR